MDARPELDALPLFAALVPSGSSIAGVRIIIIIITFVPKHSYPLPFECIILPCATYVITVTTTPQ